jgi:chromosome segregation ATPase
MGIDESSDPDEGVSESVSGLFEKLKGQLDELDRFREAVEENVKSAVSLVPGLEEEKERLQEDVETAGEKIEEMRKSISKLENQIAELDEDLRNKEERIEEIDDRLKFLSKMHKGT